MSLGWITAWRVAPEGCVRRLPLCYGLPLCAYSLPSTRISRLFYFIHKKIFIEKIKVKNFNACCSSSRQTVCLPFRWYYNIIGGTDWDDSDKVWFKRSIFCTYTYTGTLTNKINIHDNHHHLRQNFRTLRYLYFQSNTTWSGKFKSLKNDKSLQFRGKSPWWKI